ncbi:hypothetical protein PPERSA_09782 [Pseudocohnilembus persalinus]|uniref:Transmembrane protein n=1 Tax=Pseudocohnilembus persalinus TaxID=266149 RepID=A0A0V0QUE3_PSEPJ|nr:hypothetical protein PPERSA_09782 [Pseudocohnilembus persalinus]|eukprot:KRX05642.1 hypothetical protein PPERSA_09782 [Pseudocohnilembus persalinus]
MQNQNQLQRPQQKPQQLEIENNHLSESQIQQQYLHLQFSHKPGETYYQTSVLSLIIQTLLYYGDLVLSVLFLIEMFDEKKETETRKNIRLVFIIVLIAERIINIMARLLDYVSFLRFKLTLQMYRDYREQEIRDPSQKYRIVHRYNDEIHFPDLQNLQHVDLILQLIGSFTYLDALIGFFKVSQPSYRSYTTQTTKIHAFVSSLYFLFVCAFLMIQNQDDKLDYIHYLAVASISFIYNNVLIFTTNQKVSKIGQHIFVFFMIGIELATKVLLLVFLLLFVSNQDFDKTENLILYFGLIALFVIAFLVEAFQYFCKAKKNRIYYKDYPFQTLITSIIAGFAHAGYLRVTKVGVLEMDYDDEVQLDLYNIYSIKYEIESYIFLIVWRQIEFIVWFLTIYLVIDYQDFEDTYFPFSLQLSLWIVTGIQFIYNIFVLIQHGRALTKIAKSDRQALDVQIKKQKDLLQIQIQKEYRKEFMKDMNQQQRQLFIEQEKKLLQMAGKPNQIKQEDLICKEIKAEPAKIQQKNFKIINQLKKDDENVPLISGFSIILQFLFYYADLALIGYFFYTKIDDYGGDWIDNWRTLYILCALGGERLLQIIQIIFDHISFNNFNKKVPENQYQDNEIQNQETQLKKIQNVNIGLKIICCLTYTDMILALIKSTTYTGRQYATQVSKLHAFFTSVFWTFLSLHFMLEDYDYDKYIQYYAVSAINVALNNVLVYSQTNKTNTFISRISTFFICLVEFSLKVLLVTLMYTYVKKDDTQELMFYVVFGGIFLLTFILEIIVPKQFSQKLNQDDIQPLKNQYPMQNILRPILVAWGQASYCRYTDTSANTIDTWQQITLNVHNVYSVRSQMSLNYILQFLRILEFIYYAYFVFFDHDEKSVWDELEITVYALGGIEFLYFIWLTIYMGYGTKPRKYKPTQLVYSKIYYPQLQMPKAEKDSQKKLNIQPEQKKPKIEQEPKKEVIMPSVGENDIKTETKSKKLNQINKSNRQEYQMENNIYSSQFYNTSTRLPVSDYTVPDTEKNNLGFIKYCYNSNN